MPGCGRCAAFSARINGDWCRETREANSGIYRAGAAPLAVAPILRSFVLLLLAAGGLLAQKFSALLAVVIVVPGKIFEEENSNLTRSPFGFAGLTIASGWGGKSPSAARAEGVNGNERKIRR